MNPSLPDYTQIQTQIGDLIAQARKLTTSDLSRATASLHEAQQLLTEYDPDRQNFPIAHGDMCLVRGIVLFQEGQYESALMQYYEAQEIFTMCRHDEGLARTLNAMGVVFRYLGDFVHATELLEMGLEYANALNNSSLKMILFNSMSALHAIRHEHEKALLYTQQTLELARELHDANAYAVLQNNLARHYAGLEQYELALPPALESTAYFEVSDSNIYLVDCLENLGRIYLYSHDFPNALAILMRANDICLEKHFETKRLSILISLGEYYKLCGDNPSAVEYFQQVLVQAGKDEKNYATLRAYQHLSAIHKTMGQFELALNELEKANEIRTTLENHESEVNMQHLEIRFRTQKALQEAEYYRRRTHELEVLNKLKDNLYSSTSHDLKHPLSRVLLNADMLRRTENLPTERSKRLVNNIIDSTYAMTEMISDVLHWIQLENPASTPLVEQPLAPILHATAQLFRDSMETKHISLSLACDDALMVWADARQLQSAFDNLLSNAVKYTPKFGTIALSAQLEQQQVVVRIKDNGEGIPTEDMPHLFEEFYRSKRHVERQIEGTGLGLTIAKRIIEKHFGTITVFNNPDMGCTFAVMLPLSPRTHALNTSPNVG